MRSRHVLRSLTFLLRSDRPQLHPPSSKNGKGYGRPKSAISLALVDLPFRRSEIKFPISQGVESVSSDMGAHTLTMRFDDEKTSLGALVDGLGNAGYTVPSSEPVSGAD